MSDTSTGVPWSGAGVEPADFSAAVHGTKELVDRVAAAVGDYGAAGAPVESWISGLREQPAADGGVRRRLVPQPERTVAPTPDGPVTIVLPDRMSGQHWCRAEKFIAGEHVVGYPAGMPDFDMACRCGQTKVDTLRIRFGPRIRVFCEACFALPPLVGKGVQVAFRLADSDLFEYVRGVPVDQAREIVLRGTVGVQLPARQLGVYVDGWPIPHLLDTDRLVERPATWNDTRRFWPDKDEATLREAVAAIALAGGTMTVVTGEDGDFDVELGDRPDGC